MQVKPHDNQQNNSPHARGLVLTTSTRFHPRVVRPNYGDTQIRSTMINKLYAVLASLVQARINCDEATPRNDEWFDRHEQRIEELVKDMMPSGSGIDSGTQIDIDACTPDKLVFHTAYHHMAESGMYDGWTEHKLIVTPRLASNFTLRITGPDRNDIKEYLHEVFHAALDADVEPQPAAQPATASEGSV